MSIATKLLCRPRRHDSETVASKARKAAKAAVAMVAATAGATITVTETTDHPGEMTMITMTIGEIAAAKAYHLGIQEDETRGVMAPPHRTHVTAIGL